LHLNNQKPPLLVSVFSEDEAQIIKLLQLGAEIDELDTTTGWSALHLAASRGSYDIVKLLIDRGANINLQELGDQDSPLHIAINNGRQNLIMLLCSYSHINVNIQNKNGDTGLHCAVDQGLDKVVEMLLKANADPNIKDYVGQETPIIRTIIEKPVNMYKITEILLAHGADINAVDINGETALHKICEQSEFELAQYLLSKGANPNIGTKGDKNNRGRTPLHLVSQRGQDQIAKLLIQHGAIINSVVGNGRTPLHYASNMGHLAVVTLLLENGADYNAREYNTKRTALYWAMKKKFKAVVDKIEEYIRAESLLSQKQDHANPNSDDRSINELLKFINEE